VRPELRALLGCLLTFAVVVLGPFALIWSVNTLFATGIVYSVKTWTAALILFAPISPRLKVEEVK